MLSILIPTYNYDVTNLVFELHKQCEIAGIPYEIIIRDDFSEKEYKSINGKLSELTNCLYKVNERNLGRTMTRKRLAEEAVYEMLLFLDADVIPVTTDYIKTYLPYISKKLPVIFGGIAYKSGSENNNTALRLKYGREREQKSAKERKKNPYGLLFSANLLVSKDVFLENNYSKNENLYGMDVFFSYMLYKNNVPVIHVDNPVYHIGLEDDSIYFEKSLKSVSVKKNLLTDVKDIENINSLLKHYNNLKKYHLLGITKFFFKMGEPLLKKMILSKNPNLFCLDLYKLGYICSLKN